MPMGGFGPENLQWGRGASQSSPTMPAGANGDQMPMLLEGRTDGRTEGRRDLGAVGGGEGRGVGGGDKTGGALQRGAEARPAARGGGLEGRLGGRGTPARNTWYSHSGEIPQNSFWRQGRGYAESTGEWQPYSGI